MEVEMTALVRPLFDGPLDLVGDIHGEIEALRRLLGHLGYDHQGRHATGRRLVLVGDLTDRGPDSPAVVALAARLMAAGRAQMVMGNHEFNLLEGKHKHGNAWYFGQEEALIPGQPVVPQRLAGDPERQAARDLFASLPLVLERPDLRVVHACWDPAMVEAVRHETNVLDVANRYRSRIKAELERDGVADAVECELARQNRNPVKVLRSGLECRVAEPFFAGGKERWAGRVKWWDDYDDEPWCVFGHYWRRRLTGEEAGDHLFDDARPFAPLGRGRTMCIDYSVGKRWQARMDEASDPSEVWLAALRWPERELVVDDGRRIPLGWGP